MLSTPIIEASLTILQFVKMFHLDSKTNLIPGSLSTETSLSIKNSLKMPFLRWSLAPFLLKMSPFFNLEGYEPTDLV